MEGIGEAVRFMGSAQFWRMAVLWTISLVSSYLRLVIIFRWRSKVYPRCCASPAPVCIVTGVIKPRHLGFDFRSSVATALLCFALQATSGLGQATAYALSKQGFYVVLAGRSSRLLSKTVQGIREKNATARLKALEVDLSSFKSILKFKDSLASWLVDSDLHPSVQLLINNAGILATSSRQTAQGYDQMMYTNYIGPFSLTTILLPLLRNSPVGSRIVNVTSFTHRCVFDVQVDKETVAGMRFSGLTQYPYAQIYEYSKLCILLFSYQLHRELYTVDKSSGVSVVAADPGVVETNIMREVPTPLSRLAYTVLKLLRLLQSPEVGVASVLDAALAPAEASGMYFLGGNGQTVGSSALSYNNRLAEGLWEASYDLFLDSKLDPTNVL